MTNLFARTRPTSRPLLNNEDLDKILNAMKLAAILFDKKDYRIFSANSKALELSAYTRDEITAMRVNQIISGDLSGLMAVQSKKRDATLPRRELTTRSNQQINIALNATPLGDKSPWGLITFEELKFRQQKKITSSFISDLLNFKMFELLETFHLNNPEQALDKLLMLGKEMLPDSNLAIYIGRSNEPTTSIVKSTGKYVDILPEVIAPPDLLHLLQASVWVKGQRSIVTLLHQSVRSAGFEYLGSAPIKDSPDDNNWLGLFIAFGKTPTHKHILEILELLASTAAAIIHKNLLVKNLNDSITKSKERLNNWQAVQEYIQEGILTISPNREVKSINPAAELIFGYALQEILAEPIENIIVGADNLPFAIQSALQGISTPTLGSVNLHRRDGSTFPANLEVNPIKDDDSNIGAMIFVQDLSEHEQIQIKTHQLEQRALLGEVTAIFAHEVRNPINNISMGLQLLSRDLEDGDPQKERLKIMQDDCLRLTRLMDSVLTFSRTGNYAKERIDIVDLLNRILQRWHPRFTNVKIDYSVQSQENLDPVLGDFRSLEQVFTNIISNAVQAMMESGGTFAVKISRNNDNGNKPMAQIDLTDSGPGIPQEIQAKIFDPFFTTNTNGTGLGLSISKQIVLAHKGSITLTSYPGITSFRVQLPTTNKLEEPVL